MNETSWRRTTGRARALTTVLLGALVFWGANGCGKEGDVSQILDVRAPAVVKNLQAFPADQKVRVTWAPGSEPDLLGYNVYRSTSADGEFELVGSTGTQQAPFFQDEGDDVNGDGVPDGLVNQITYFYKVTAFDREARETSLDLAAVVSAVPGVSPGSLQDLFVTNVRAYGGDRRAVVTWDLNQNTSVFGYFVYRSQLGAPQGFQLAALVPQGRNSFADGGLPNGSEFAYAVAPVTRDLFEGRRVESRAVRVDPGDFTRPKPPGSDTVTGELTLQDVSASGVTMRWGRPTENTDGSVLNTAAGTDDLEGGGFLVLRANAPEGNFEAVGILEDIGTETTFTFTDPQGTSQHFYVVRAFDRLGTLSEPSSILSAGSQVVPDVIRGVDAFASTSFSTISVNWDLEPTATSGYRVFRSTRRDRGYAQISGNLPPTQNFFQDGVAALRTGETFFYRVAGLFQDGQGEIVQGSLSTPAPAVAGPSDGVFYLEAEDATVLGVVPGDFDSIARQGFPAPFSNLGTLFVDPSATAVPSVAFMILQWSVEIDASGPAGAPGTYDVFLRTIRNERAGIFDVVVQQPTAFSIVRRNAVDFHTNDFAFPPRVHSLFLGQMTVVDQDNVGGNPTNETIQMTLIYEGFNPAVPVGNGELFVDGLALVRR